MTGPLSNAVSGASYSGAFGTQGGDLARAAGAFMKGVQEKKERAAKAALDQALRELQMRQIDQQLELKRNQFVADQNYRNEDMDLRRAAAAQGAVAATEAANTAAEQRAQNAALAREQIQNEKDVARINAASRQAVAGSRTLTSGRDYVIKEDSQGKVWNINKTTGQITPIGQDAQNQMLGAGARPSQGERDALATYESFKTAAETLKKNMAAVGGKAPSLSTQLMLDASKTSGTGLIGNLTRSLGNTALGKVAPEYQLIQNSIDAAGSFFVKMMTGAQMGEKEAVRLFNVFGPKAGSTPETIAQQLQQLDDIIKAQYAKVGRAAELNAQGLPFTTTAPATTAPPTDVTDLKKKYNLE